MVGLNWLPNFGEEIAMILFGIGFANLLFQKNLIKKIMYNSCSKFLFFAIYGIRIFCYTYSQTAIIIFVISEREAGMYEKTITGWV